MSNFKGTKTGCVITEGKTLQEFYVLDKFQNNRIIGLFGYGNEKIIIEYPNQSISKANAQLFVEALEVRNSIDITLTDLLEQRNQLLAFAVEFITAVENEEIIIQENLDNDGHESIGSRLFQNAKKAVETSKN